MKVFCSQGVLIISNVDLKKEQKIKVQKDNNFLYYNVTNFNVFPCQFGDGKYIITLYELVTREKYKVVERKKIRVKISNPNTPYLVPNQYVNYDPASLPKMREERIQFFMHDYQYDFVRAANIKNNDILPDINYVLQNKRGICQDLAALAVALYRVIGIPAKLVIGKADGIYHAWVIFLKNDKWYRYDPTASFLGKKIKKYSVERWY